MRGRGRWMLHAALLVHASVLCAQVSPRCLTPEAGVALRTVVESGALSGVLGPQLRLEKVNVTGSAIELVISDAAQREHGISLALPEAGRGTPDGQGRQLWYYLTTAAGDRTLEASRALLAAAALFDQALPPSAIVICGGVPPPSPAQQPVVVEAGSSRALALASAILQIAVMIAALGVGLFVVASGDAPQERESQRSRFGGRD